MILLIVIPFITLIIAITAIRMMRTVRNLREIQANRPALTVPSTHRKPSDEFHDNVWLPLCQSVADLVEEKLKRPLTIIERKAIWRSRTPAVLEDAMKKVVAATSPEEVSALLAALPSGMDRPDPTAWCAGKSKS